MRTAAGPSWWGKRGTSDTRAESTQIDRGGGLSLGMFLICYYNNSQSVRKIVDVDFISLPKA